MPLPVQTLVNMMFGLGVACCVETNGCRCFDMYHLLLLCALIHLASLCYVDVMSDNHVVKGIRITKEWKIIHNLVHQVSNECRATGSPHSDVSSLSSTSLRLYSQFLHSPSHQNVAFFLCFFVFSVQVTFWRSNKTVFAGCIFVSWLTVKAKYTCVCCWK